jgi:hypothetical protein
MDRREAEARHQAQQNSVSRLTESQVPDQEDMWFKLVVGWAGWVGRSAVGGGVAVGGGSIASWNIGCGTRLAGAELLGTRLRGWEPDVAGEPPPWMDRRSAKPSAACLGVPPTAARLRPDDEATTTSLLVVASVDVETFQQRSLGKRSCRSVESWRAWCGTPSTQSRTLKDSLAVSAPARRVCNLARPTATPALEDSARSRMAGDGSSSRNPFGGQNSTPMSRCGIPSHFPTASCTASRVTEMAMSPRYHLCRVIKQRRLQFYRPGLRGSPAWGWHGWRSGGRPWPWKPRAVIYGSLGRLKSGG